MQSCLEGLLGPRWALGPGDPHSLCVLDGPVQGAEERATLLHHTVEVGLVQKVTLGVTEVLGTEPGGSSQPVRGRAGVGRPGSRRLQPHLRRYAFQGSDSFS